MDQRARNYIEKIAEFVLKEFNIQSPIQDIDQVVLQLNGYIYSVDDVFVNSSIEKLDNENHSFTIIVSSCQPDVRRTFAIAQQLGHLFLHMGYFSDSDIWNSFNNQIALENYTEKEFQTHEFALNFLMPKKQYLSYISKNAKDNHIDSYAIAQYFGVSESNATIRGKLIGAIKWR